MIDHINSSQTCHIMTVEDPVTEFLIRDKRSIRQITAESAYDSCLRNRRRCDAPFVMITIDPCGEIRTRVGSSTVMMCVRMWLS